MAWAIAFSVVVLGVAVWRLARAAQPAKARAHLRGARCPVCDGLGFQQGALTTVKADGPVSWTAKCQLCGDRVRFDGKGAPIR